MRIRRADDDGDVAGEGRGLDRDVALVVVHRQHDVVAPFHALAEHAVGADRPAGIDAAGARTLHAGGDLLFVLRAHRMRVEAGHADARAGDAPLPQRRVELAQRRGDQARGDQLRHFAQRHVVGEVGHAQRAGGEQQVAAAGLDLHHAVEHAGALHRHRADRRHHGGLQAPAARQLVGLVEPHRAGAPAGSAVRAGRDVGRIEGAGVEDFDDVTPSGQALDGVDAAQLQAGAGLRHRLPHRVGTADQQRPALGMQAAIGQRLGDDLRADAAGVADDDADGRTGAGLASRGASAGGSGLHEILVSLVIFLFSARKRLRVNPQPSPAARPSQRAAFSCDRRRRVASSKGSASSRSAGCRSMIANG
jgi:hypothetical protein